MTASAPAGAIRPPSPSIRAEPSPLAADGALDGNPQDFEIRRAEAERASLLDAGDGSAARVREHMEVVGADGAHVGTVDKVRGEHIILTRSDPASAGVHHAIPLAWIASVDDKVKLDLPPTRRCASGARRAAAAPCSNARIRGATARTPSTAPFRGPIPTRTDTPFPVPPFPVAAGRNLTRPPRIGRVFFDSSRPIAHSSRGNDEGKCNDHQPRLASDVAPDGPSEHGQFRARGGAAARAPGRLGRGSRTSGCRSIPICAGG